MNPTGGRSEGFAEERSDTLFGIGRGFGTIAILIIGILEGVTRSAIDFDVGALSGGFHGLSKCLNAFGRDALILRTEIPHHGRTDFGDEGLVGGE